MYSKSSSKWVSAERGFATITTSIILLFAFSLIGVFTAKNAIVEQKVVTNEYRIEKSFEAAEAGLEYGGAYLESSKVPILTDADNDGFIDAYTSTNTSNVTQADSTVYSITYANPTANDFSLIEVTATGRSTDGLVTRTTKQLYANLPFMAVSSRAPLIAKGAVDLGGNVTITNTITVPTIWSGGGINLTGAATTDAGNGEGSSSGNIGADIAQNDAALGGLTNDQFFQNFFHDTPDNIKAAANTYYSNSTNTNYSDLVDGLQGQLIWIDQPAGEARFASNTVVGSPEHPVILIVDGDVKLTGTLTVYGVVYIARSWSNSGAGTLDVRGSVIVQGNLDATGTPDVTYNDTILNQLTQTVGQYVKVPGSWRDL